MRTETNKLLEVGIKAPGFTLPDGEGNAVSLADFAGKKSANKKSRGNLQKMRKKGMIEKGHNKTSHHHSAGLERISSSVYADVSGADSAGSSSFARYSFTLP